MKVNLLPCPFCGATQGIGYGPYLEKEKVNSGWRVICYACYVQTTAYMGQDGAVQNWNRRNVAKTDQSVGDGLSLDKPTTDIIYGADYGGPKTDQSAPPKPSIGRIVHYRLTEIDVNNILRRRTNGLDIARRIKLNTPDEPSSGWPIGAQAHIGTDPAVGDVLPMMIVRVGITSSPDDPSGCQTVAEVNGQVFLDGNDVLWVCGIVEGTTPGTWSWPPKV